MLFSKNSTIGEEKWNGGERKFHIEPQEPLVFTIKIIKYPKHCNTD